MKKIIALILAFCLSTALVACGQSTPTEPVASVELEMTQVYAGLEEAVQLPEMIAMDEILMLDYCGIKAEDVKQAVVVICADSLRTDEIWLLEAVDAAALARLQKLVDNRLQTKAEESITYSPEQYAVVEKAQCIVAGNYLALLVSPDVEALAANFRTQAGM